VAEATAALGLPLPRRLQPSQSARSPLSAKAWRYWLSVVTPALAAAALAAPALQAANGWGRFAFLAAAASVAQLSAVQLTRNRVFHPAVVFVVAGALLLSPQQLVLMCLIQHLPDWIRQRYAWYIQPFNIANYVLSAAACSFAARGIVQLDNGAIARYAYAGLVAAAVFVAVNRLLLAGMLRYGRGLTLAESGLFRLDDLALEVVLALIAVPFVVLWRQDGLAVAGISLVPLLLIQFTQRASHGLEVALEKIGEQSAEIAAASELVMQRSTAALEALSATVDARDTYTAGHSRRVREISLAIARRLELGSYELETVAQAAILHDIGKIAVPDAVLLKHGSLDQTEWKLMQSHPEAGAQIVERLGYLDQVVPAIRHHHERPDGRGYPHGLLGDEIPLAARIIHVADALDAMITQRVYRESMPLQDALDEIHRGNGNDFCSHCIAALDRAIAVGELSEILELTAGVAA
jgi:putative nucleotidyltransferase with HDIG domain